MKIHCFCGKDFEINDLEYIEPFRRACPHCKRSYSLTVELIPEVKEFWK